MRTRPRRARKAKGGVSAPETAGAPGASVEEPLRIHRDLTRKERRRRRLVVVGKIAFVVMLLAFSAVLPVFVNNAIGYIPVVAVLASILLAFLYLQLLKRALVFEEDSDLHDCERGEQVVFSVRFRNRMPLLFFRIEAYFYISDQYGKVVRESMTTLALAPFEQTNVDFAVRFDHVGTHAAGLEKVVICDFFRLFTSTRENGVAHTVQVTPRVQPVDGIVFTNESEVENAHVSKSVLSDSLDYAYVRNYVPGDPLKTIHWKISARSENYMTRLFEVYTNPGVAVMMGFYAPVAGVEDTAGMFDCVLESAISIEAYAREQGMDTVLLYNDRYGAPVSKPAWTADDLPQMVESMPRLSDDEELHVQTMSHLRRQVAEQNTFGNIILCTADLGPETVDVLMEAKALGKTPLLVAIVPASLVDREREDYIAGLSRLSDANVGYIAISKSEDLVEVAL